MSSTVKNEFYFTMIQFTALKFSFGEISKKNVTDATKTSTTLQLLGFNDQ